MKINIIICFLCCLFLSCATFVNNGKYKLVVNTEPDSCEIYFNNKYLGISPLRIRVNHEECKKKWNFLLIKKDGYLPKKIPLYKRFEPGYIIADFFIACLTGGTLGAIIGAGLAPSPSPSGDFWADILNSWGVLGTYMSYGWLIGFSTVFVFSLIMDYNTGSFYFLEPDSVEVKLEKKIE